MPSDVVGIHLLNLNLLFSSSTAWQTPLDFILHGVLADGEKIGFMTIPAACPQQDCPVGLTKEKNLAKCRFGDLTFWHPNLFKIVLKETSFNGNEFLTSQASTLEIQRQNGHFELDLAAL